MPGQPALFDKGLVEPPPAPEPPRTYWENRGPHDWQPVTVVCRYGPTHGSPAVFPHVTTKPAGPRNVQILRADGTGDIVPVRNLRRRNPERNNASGAYRCVYTAAYRIRVTVTV